MCIRDRSSVTKTLGPKLAAKTTPAANTIKAEAALTAAAGNLNREEFALRQVHEGGVEADAARSKAKATQTFVRVSRVDHALDRLKEQSSSSDIVDDAGLRAQRPQNT